ncbi:unnamed protein product [Acanthosepion pharaonis]|uniref:Uncharacterized protein n=1 Tax=Acanthosepion pharaonis TaxID=158019 RepID=A0A812CKJ2_ACAPH|nr:unnamed protein product [Sepia pharaonis]
MSPRHLPSVHKEFPSSRLVHKRRSCLAPPSGEFPSYYLFTKRRSCLAPPVCGIPSLLLVQPPSVNSLPITCSQKTIMSRTSRPFTKNSLPITCSQNDHDHVPSYYSRSQKNSPPVRGIPFVYLFTKDDHVSHLPSGEFPSYYLFTKTIMSRTSRLKFPSYYLFTKDYHVSHLPSEEFPSYYLFTKDDHVSHLPSEEFLPITCSQRRSCLAPPVRGIPFLLLVHKRRSCLAPPVRGIPFLLLVHKRRSCLAPPVRGFPSYYLFTKDDHVSFFSPSGEFPSYYLFTKDDHVSRTSVLPSEEFPSYYLFTKDDHRTSRLCNSSPRPRNSSQKTIMSRTSRPFLPITYDHVSHLPSVRGIPSLLLVHKRRSCLTSRPTFLLVPTNSLPV